MNKVVKSTVVYVLVAILGLFLLAKALTATPGRERVDTLEFSKLIDAHQVDTAMPSKNSGQLVVSNPVDLDVKVLGFAPQESVPDGAAHYTTLTRNVVTAGPNTRMFVAFPSNDGDLVDILAMWVPDAAVRQRILVDNPARLYWS